MTECNHRTPIGTTMYAGKIWRCIDCGQEMKCVGVGEHKELSRTEQPHRD